MTYATGIIGTVLVLSIIIHLTRTNRLQERQAIWWLVVGVLAMVVSIIPSSLDWIASLLGVAVPTNLAFFVAIALLAIVTLQLSADLTKIESRTRKLAEEHALLKQQVEKLIQQLDL